MLNTCSGIQRFADTFPPAYTTEAALLHDVKRFLSCIDNLLLVRQEALGKSGIADLIIFYRGRAVAIELKDDTGVASIQQKEWLHKAVEAGAYTGIARNIAQVAAILCSVF